MTLMQSDGSTVYVWNPYSLAELKGMLGAPTASGQSVLDECLHCVATGSACTPHSASIFDSQQVLGAPKRQRVFEKLIPDCTTCCVTSSAGEGVVVQGWQLLLP